MNNRTIRICLVEDDPIMGESLCYRFDLEGITCDWFRNATDALERFGREDYAALISDIRLPDMSGMELYDQLLIRGTPLPPAIFITGFGSISDAVELLKKGAADYVTKPFDLDTLVEKIHAVCTRPERMAQERGASLGISAAMRKVEETLCRVSKHSATVLITGESGVGKEYAARFLHECTDHSDRPFVAVNCGAIPESLMESELFGYEKGAFTGAVRNHRGVFEQASGGTIFLDEVGEMSPMMQVRLLRVIQERQVVRVGGEETIPLEVRIICATNRDLRGMVAEGTFREDLYYRINVVHVELPPLRERREDILWFARRFLAGMPGGRHLLPSAETLLLDYEWPGNLRELSHSIERACILSQEPGLGREAFPSLAGGRETSPAGNLRERIHHYERQVIIEALNRHDFQIGETANELGISRKNLWEKMKKLDIDREQ